MENLLFDKVLLKNAKMLNLSETKTNQGDSAQNSLFVEVFEKSLLSIGFELTHQLKEVLLNKSISELQECYALINSVFSLPNYDVLYNTISKDDEQTILEQTLQKITSNIKTDEKIQLDLFSVEKAELLFKNLLGSSISWTQNDKELVQILYPLFYNQKFEALDNKENNAFLASVIFRETQDKDKIIPFIKTSKDLLRFVFAIKERDINSEDGIFGFKFSRPEQRILLEIVDNNNFILDMFKDEFEFKVLSKKIHSLTKENSRKYPNQAKQFKMLLDNKKPENWNNKFNLILSSPDFVTEEHLSEVLLQRPTDFSRNIIVLLSKYNPDTIISLYSKVIKYVPFKALSELYSALITPEYEHNRIVLIKNKFKSIGDSEVVLSDKVKENLISLIIEEMKNKFKGKVNENTVFIIDEDLNSITLPFSERETSSKVNFIPKLSRIKLSDKLEFVRTFVYWKNNSEYEHTDLDLSLIAVKDDGSTTISSWDNDFNTQRGEGVIFTYSGDKQNAVDGAAEYHDLYIDQLKKQGYKYIVSDLRSFTNQSFSEIKEVFFGYQFNQSEPSVSSSEQVFDINNLSTNMTLFVLDLEKMELIFVNSPIKSKSNRVSSSFDKETIDRIINLKKITVSEVLNLIAEANNIPVFNSVRDDNLLELLSSNSKTILEKYDFPTKGKPFDFEKLNTFF